MCARLRAQALRPPSHCGCLGYLAIVKRTKLGQMLAIVDGNTEGGCASTGTMNDSGYLDDSRTRRGNNALAPTSLISTLAQRQLSAQQTCISHDTYDQACHWDAYHAAPQSHQSQRTHYSDAVSDSDGSTSSSYQRALEQEWQDQLDQLKLILQIIVFPFVGKFFGRKFGYFRKSTAVCAVCLLPTDKQALRSCSVQPIQAFRLAVWRQILVRHRRRCLANQVELSQPMLHMHQFNSFTQPKRVERMCRIASTSVKKGYNRLHVRRKKRCHLVKKLGSLLARLTTNTKLSTTARTQPTLVTTNT